MIDVIMSRSSYRGTYKNTSIPREDLKQIMKAGLAAPSGCNKQTTSLIAVDDKVILDNLKSLIDPPICQTAPAFILVLTQRIFAYRDKCFQVQDYSANLDREKNLRSKGLRFFFELFLMCVLHMTKKQLAL